jgi:cell wall-associated NlpC family hydrolase
MISTFPWHHRVTAFCQFTTFSGSYVALRRSVCSMVIPNHCARGVLGCQATDPRKAVLRMGLGRTSGISLHDLAPPADKTAIVKGALFLLAAASLTGCASTGAVPRPFPTPGNPPVATRGRDVPPPSETPPPSAPASGAAADPAARAADGYALAGTALSLRGAPYRNQGTDPSGFDCSGFVQYVFHQYGLALPREVREQFRKGKRVDAGQLEPGDLVFFTTVAPGASHVGIAVGGDQFVHAPSERGVVRVEQLGAAYWRTRFVGARRVL